MIILPDADPIAPIDKLDLAQLPLSQVVTMLRGLGRQLFSAALAAAAPPPLPTLLADQSDMLGAQWLLHQGHQRQRQSIAGGSQPFTVRARITVARAFGRAPVDSYERTFGDALDGHLSEPAWRARLLDELERQLGVTQPPFAPDQFWAILSLAAWSDLGFQRALTTELWGYLRLCTLCIPGDIEHANWSPNTFWTLIDLTAPGDLTRRQRAFRGQRLAFDAGQRLRVEARRQALVRGWAGFWDQWIILRARSFWSDGIGVGPSPLRQAVDALPLLEEPRSRRGQPASTPVQLECAGWQQEAPSWYPGLVDFRSR